MILARLLLLMAAAQPTPLPTTKSLTAIRDSYPHLSPDGRRLLFHSNRLERRSIWIADADGSNARVLFDGGTIGVDPSSPVWSQDGRRIAFAMKPAGATDPNESEIYVMNADGTDVRRLTTAPGDDSHPHWSESGRIYFNSARATPDLKAEWSRQWIDIYSMTADGGDLRRHTRCRSTCTYPVPSPDERFIVHRRATATMGQNWDLTPGMRNSEVFVTSLDGSSSVNVSNSPAYDGWPAWSPDGKWIVFASNRDKMAYTGQIYAVRPDGSNLRALTSGGWSRVQPSFSRAGDTIFVNEHIENDRFELGHIASFSPNLEE